MANEDIYYKSWRIQVTPYVSGWKALLYRPAGEKSEPAIPIGSDRKLVIAEAKQYIDRTSRR